MNASKVWLLSGLFLVFYGIYLFVRVRIAASWPTVIASVVERSPQSMFEKVSSRKWTLNTDSDHFLTWTVDGQEYEKPLEDESHAYIGGIKVWRKTPELGEKVIQYNPQKPQDCVLPEEQNDWKWMIALGVLVVGISTFINPA